MFLSERNGIWDNSFKLNSNNSSSNNNSSESERLLCLWLCPNYLIYSASGPPCGPVVEICLPVHGVQVRSRIGELRSPMPRKPKHKRHCNKFNKDDPCQKKIFKKNLLCIITQRSWGISNPKRWCCESAALNMPANLENSAVAIGLEKVSFHSNPKERQCQRMLKLPHNCTHLTH